MHSLTSKKKEKKRSFTPEASHSAALWHPCLQWRQWITFPGSSFLSAVIPWSRRQSLHHNQQLESHTNYPQEPTAESRKWPQIFPEIESGDTCDSGKRRHMYANENHREEDAKEIMSFIAIGWIMKPGACCRVDWKGEAPVMIISATAFRSQDSRNCAEDPRGLPLHNSLFMIVNELSCHLTAFRSAVVSLLTAFSASGTFVSRLS